MALSSKGYRSMAAQQKGQRIAMPEEKRQKHRRILRVRLLIALVILIFAISAVILILHEAFLGPWSNIFIVIFSVLGILIALVQWYSPIPVSSESATTSSPSPKVDST